MSEKTQQRQSQLIEVLREGIGIMQMVLFKELRTLFATKYPQRDNVNRAMLTGAIINSLFGLENPEEKFIIYRKENEAVIEQELLGFTDQLGKLCPIITDALRIQVLCDNQEGVAHDYSARALQQAKELGILREEREIPLPSAFMTRVRRLGEEHGLTIAPVEISSDDDSTIVH